MPGLWPNIISISSANRLKSANNAAIRNKAIECTCSKLDLCVVLSNLKTDNNSGQRKFNHILTIIFIILPITGLFKKQISLNTIFQGHWDYLSSHLYTSQWYM